MTHDDAVGTGAGDEQAAILERAQGCLLGQLTGDALGSMVEFESEAAIRREYPSGLREIAGSPVHHTAAGQPTDDSEMALALARTLARGGFDERAVAAAYAAWFSSHPFDWGLATQAALGPAAEAARKGADPAEAAKRHAQPNTEANGALMRQSPLAIWGQALPAEQLDAVVRADTRLTHPCQTTQDASAAFIIALAATIREGLDGPAAYARACEWDRAHGQSPKVTEALAAARESRPPDYQTHKGHVIIALRNAFYQALHAESVEEGVVDTVMRGGDTDTNAAIAGALLGAIYGAAGVPAQWREAVLNCRPESGRAGVSQPRPEIYWPVDALELAGKLLAAGPAPAGRGAGGSGGAAPDRASRGATPIRRGSAGAQAGPPSLGRFTGALLGGAIGDALGAPLEGGGGQRFRAEYGRIRDYLIFGNGWRATITDDTQMTMCVAECLLANGWLDPEDLTRRFVAWLPEGRGKGRITAAALEDARGGKPWWAAADYTRSAGNGAAMRTAPIGLLRWADPQRCRSEAVLSALPTHSQPMAVAGAVAMAAATAWLVARQASAWSPEEFIGAVRDAVAGLEPKGLAERERPEVVTTLHDRIGEVLGWLDEPHTVPFRRHSGGFVLESVPAALYYFLRFRDDPEEAIIAAVNETRDADTVGAMAGTLVGAAHGVEALPSRLLEPLEYRERLTALGEALFRLATG